MRFSLNKSLKKILRTGRYHLKSAYLFHRLNYLERRLSKHHPYEFNAFKLKVVAFIRSRASFADFYKYTYSESCKKPTLYASTYACMTLSLLGELQQYTHDARREWASYFDSFQNPDDGLFYDPVVLNDLYQDSDWWGARHLALHMISAYTVLGCTPKYQFRFLEAYYQKGAITNWLETQPWDSAEIGDGDVDNKIMNIGCLLQYQRDTWCDKNAAQALAELKSFLRSRLNKETGMWGGFELRNSQQRSRMIQFAYHLFPIFFYDGDYDFDAESIVSTTLASQNKLGGFGVELNSSACEDIDSIDLLIRLHDHCTMNTKASIRKAITKAFKWVVQNQVADGGFVFRLEEPFVYGSVETSSRKNEGAMLATWFRTLSLAYMSAFFGKEKAFRIVNCPGYEFQ